MAAVHINFLVQESNLSPKVTLLFKSTIMKSTDLFKYVKILGVACHCIQLDIKNYNFV